MIYPLLRNILFQFDAEKAHHFSLNTLKKLYALGLLKQHTFSAHSRDVMGLTFPNAIGLAAGLDRNGDYIDALATFGFGFIEIGTITPNPVLGNPKPRMFRIPKEEALINRMGFANSGLTYTINNLKKIKYRGILGINIGKNPNTYNEHAGEDYCHCFKALAPFASYITMNISSPNTIGLRELQHHDQLIKLLSAVKKEQAKFFKEEKKYVPLVVKIAPDLKATEIADIAHVLLQEKIDGVIATNTSIQRPLPMGTPNMHEKGGLSGRPLHPLSLQVIKGLKKVLGEQIPIIGCGGNISQDFAQEKLKAGASLLQVYTGFIYKGPRLIRELAINP